MYQTNLPGMEPQPPREQIASLLKFLNEEIDSCRNVFYDAVKSGKDALPDRVLGYRKVTKVLNNEHLIARLDNDLALQTMYNSVVKNVNDLRKDIHSSDYAFVGASEFSKETDLFFTEKDRRYVEELYKDFPFEVPSEDTIENRI